MVDTLAKNSNLCGDTLRGGDSGRGRSAHLPADRA